MISKRCPECGNLIEIDERGYNEGEVLDVNCPLCDYTLEVVVPKKKVEPDPSPKELVTVAHQDTVTNTSGAVVSQQEHDLKMKQMELEIEKAKAAAAAAAAIAQQTHAQMSQQKELMQQHQQQYQQQYQQPQYQYQQPQTIYVQDDYQPSSSKSKTVAILLAFFLGSFGAHKFYLGKPVMGVLYLIFFWTYIPSFLSLIEAVIYLCTSESDFQSKYCN